MMRALPIHFLALAGTILVLTPCLSRASGDEDGGPAGADPASSPDGSIVAIASDRTEGVSEIWLLDRSSMTPTRLLSEGTFSEARDPSWSPDGASLVFEARVDGGPRQIWTALADGSVLTQLTSGSDENTDPSWAPVGDRIAFTSSRTGRPQLWAMDVDGGNPELVVSTPFDATSPAWSPDATSIAFSGCTTDCSVYSVEVATEALTTVSALGDNAIEPAWGSAGILYSASAGGQRRIWLADPDASTTALYAQSTQGGDYQPAFDHSAAGGIFVSRSIAQEAADSSIWHLLPAAGTQTQLTSFQEFIPAPEPGFAISLLGGATVLSFLTRRRKVEQLEMT